MGKDNMGKGSANVTDNAAADTLGASSGTEKVTLAVSNLPEHEHDMINDRDGGEGSQFYAFSDTSSVANLGASGTVEKTDLVGTGTGALYAGSGGIDTQSTLGQPIDVMNPFLTLNYLIYAGE
jgi:microcystin-dependent protein